MHDMSLPNGDRDDWEEDLDKVFAVAETQMTLYEGVGIPSQKAIWMNAELHGWHDPACSLETDLLLIHSEVSEACEALREGNIVGDHGVGEELADVVIRVFHTAEKNNIDIAKLIREKHKKNIDRPYRHGNKKF